MMNVRNPTRYTASGRMVAGVAVFVAILCPALAALGSPSFCLLARTDAMVQSGQLAIRSPIEVSGKKATLLDLFEEEQVPVEWKSPMAATDIGAAPGPGEEKRIDPEQLRAYLRQWFDARGLDIERVQIRIPDKIILVRRQARLTVSQITDYYRQAVLARVPYDEGDLVIDQVRCADLPLLPAGEISYEVAAAPNETFLGDVSFTLHFFVDGERSGSARVSGRVDLYRDVLVARNPLSRDQIVAPGDIQFVRTNTTSHPERFVTELEQVVGKRLIRDVGPGKPLTPRDLDKPIILKRGASVTIVYESEGLRLTARGQVRENGGTGDRIKVTNVDTGQNIFCNVIDAQTVQVVP